MAKQEQSKNNSVYEVLKTVRPFSMLSPEELKRLVPKTLQRTFPADTFIFRQGEDSKKVLFIIVSGLVQINVKNEKGIESVAGYRREGDFFGETVILSDKTYPASVKAISELECLMVKREHFEEILEQNASFASFFGQVVVDRFRSLFQEVALELGPSATFESHAALKRASELMSRPVVTCSPLEKAHQVAKIMRHNHISAVVLTDKDGRVAGLVTEKDLVDKVIANNQSPDHITAMEIAAANPVRIEPDLFYYQVLLHLIRKQAKHAIVTENQMPLGIITIRDLIRSRNTGVISVVDRIESQTSIDDLAQASQEVDQILKGLVAENAPIPEILDIITEFYDRLTRQVIDIVIDQMMAVYGPPPLKFCWLTMGSGGRREQYLRTDQDNALIYQDSDDERVVKDAERYFAHLAGLVVDGLNKCGFSYCQGKVMASNPFWRGSRTYWQSQVLNWVRRSESDHIRLLTIFLDFRPVYGYTPLADELRQFTNESFSGQSLALRFLAEDASQGRVPLNFLGRPVGERSKEHRSEINLKTSVAVHLVDCVRLWTLKEKGSGVNTLERLQFLKQKKHLSRDLLDLLETSFHTIMLFRLRADLEKVNAGAGADSYLELSSLSSQETALLRDALKTIDKFMTITREEHLVF